MPSTRLILGLTATTAAAAAPVKVFIMMGQSNMLGEGNVSPVTKNGTLEFAVEQGKYPYLGKGEGAWTYSKNVRNVFTMGSGGPNAGIKMQHNDWMGVNTTIKSQIGPELGIGFAFDGAKFGDVMCLKTCIGDRALGWDLLPPGSPGFDYTDSKGAEWTYAGYHQSPARWAKGTTPKPIGWEAGIQYDGDIGRANYVLGNLTSYYPGATGYEVAGFFWWQGDRDSRDMALAGRYEQNLVKLIKTLRTQFKAPNAPFVTASLGQTAKGATDGGGLILDAMLAVDGTSGKYPEFKGNVAAVYTHPLMVTPSSSGSHYSRDARTYMNVGEAMGAAMVKMMA